MKKLLAAALAAAFVALGGAMFAAPALAQSNMPQFSDSLQFPDGSPRPFRATKFAGEQVRLNGGTGGIGNSTNDVVTFGFTSDYVRICQVGRGDPVYVRFGTAVPTGATTLTVFASGDANVRGTALVVSAASSDNTNSNAWHSSVCIDGPIAAGGVILAVNTGTRATLDVIAIGD